MRAESRLKPTRKRGGVWPSRWPRWMTPRGRVFRRRPSPGRTDIDEPFQPARERAEVEGKLTTDGRRTMATITVSLSQTGLGYSPSNPALWPSGQTKFTWQLGAATSNSTPMFVRSSIHATGNNAGSVTWDIPAPDINGNVDHFSATFNNTSTQPVGDPGVSFSVVNRYNGFVIDGGSTIRDKGTSIWVWDLIVSLVSLLAGAAIGSL